MTGYELVLYRPDGSSERYKIPANGLVLGRSVDCDIVLGYQSVSRKHARIWLEGEDLCIEDLGSSNGIELNNLRTLRGCLNDGDEVQVGEVTFRIARTADSTLGHSFITPRRAAELRQEIIESTNNPRLVLLYRAASLLGGVFNLGQLLDEILRLIFEAIPARRGFVLTMGEDEHAEPVMHASCAQEGEAPQGPPLSKTLVRHVLTRREAMLTLDAATDERFEASDSIVGHNIHAAMCAPLIAQDRVVGAIYVDTGAGARPFGMGDLELLSAVAGVVGVAVENARLYEENLRRERAAAVGTATASLGHCVKNILSGIRGGTDLVTMALQKRDLNLVERAWPILGRSIDRVDLLVNNMLSYSKDRQPQRQPIDLRDLLNEVADNQAQRAEHAGVTLTRQIERGPLFSADPTDLHRVLLNLLVNAIEACEKSKGTVTLRCRQDAEGAHIEVADTGPGIPEAVLKRLPEAFLSTKGGSGTGLGLVCAYKIVREHGGRIDVHSAPGEGAVFRVFLPHEARPGLATQRIPAPERPAAAAD